MNKTTTLVSKTAILQNLQRLLALIEQTPETNLDLNHYENQAECGTLHCVYGWAAQDPYFQQLGCEVLDGIALFKGKWLEHLYISVLDADLDTVFGPNSNMRLFRSCSWGDFDRDLAAEAEKGHKALALARIRRQITEVEAL